MTLADAYEQQVRGMDPTNRSTSHRPPTLSSTGLLTCLGSLLGAGAIEVRQRPYIIIHDQDRKTQGHQPIYHTTPFMPPRPMSVCAHTATHVRARPLLAHFHSPGDACSHSHSHARTSLACSHDPSRTTRTRPDAPCHLCAHRS
jgi:hypothetical protein